MAEGDTVSGDGWISDESSFYGDEDEQDQLLSRCDDFDPDAFWKYQHRDINAMLVGARNKPGPDLHNIYEGRVDSWQSHESVDDFIARLPPRTTSIDVCPWIWVANPYPEGRENSKGSLIHDFVALGRDLLHESLQARRGIFKQNLQNAQRSRLLNQESEALKQRITTIAERTRVLHGKWMLFPPLEDLTRVWKLVVEGTISNRLGSAAKISTEEDGKETRLICVYTKDFRDAENVLHVLNELVAMGLVSGRGIYYKSDAYTHLDVYSKNEYGLQSSIYASHKMLAAPSPQSKKRQEKKQSTLLPAFS